jgi:hypothetical protein
MTIELLLYRDRNGRYRCRLRRGDDEIRTGPCPADGIAAVAALALLRVLDAERQGALP